MSTRQEAKHTLSFTFRQEGGIGGTQITLWGGLCIVGGGPCAVSRSVITKMSLLPSTTFWDNAFGYLGHELGHGWQGVVGQGDMPWWINDGEGYPGYLNLHAWTDLGLCPLIEDWYSEAYSYYLEYMADPTTRHDHANLVIATGLREEYGWDWLREIHSAILGGRLNLSGLSEQEKTDQMIAFLSQFLEENLVPYFDQNLIYASQWVRESLAGLPGSDAQFLRNGVVQQVLWAPAPHHFLSWLNLADQFLHHRSSI